MVYRIFEKPFLLFAGCCSSFVRVADVLPNLEMLNGVKSDESYPI